MYVNRTLRDKTFIVIGTGTSGLITAGALSNSFPKCNIKVIDKVEPKTIGVGEGTTPLFETTMQGCGFQIADWFEPLQATWKLGVLYKNWNGNNDVTWHPFKVVDNMFELFCGSNLSPQELKEYVFPEWIAWQQHNKEIIFDNMHANALACHIDASLLHNFLIDKLKKRVNVEFIFDDVVDVTYNEESLGAVICESGKIYPADLYFDCSGFASILSQNRQRINLLGDLFVNSAVVCQLPFDDIQLPTATVATACDHGWIWEIPTQARIGSGLLFNTYCTSIDEAKTTLINHWSEKGGTVNPDVIRVLDWNPFYLVEPWHENVISCGLTASFVEPLEATTIHQLGFMMDQIIINIENYFHSEDKDTIRQNYNNTHCNYVQEIVDFLRIHYDCPRNNSPFWQYVRNNFKVSDRQKYYEQLMEDPNASINVIDRERELIFVYYNYAIWWAQHKNKKPLVNHHLDENSLLQLMQEHIAKIKQKASKTYSTLELSNYYNNKFSQRKLPSS